MAHPPPLPIVIAPVRAADAGLLVDVPNGWLFQVIPVSVHDDETANTSSVRQAAGIAVTHNLSVAFDTVAVTGIRGEHVVRSNTRYGRLLRLIGGSLLIVQRLPLLVVGAF
jgi:hypothetical protein